MDWPKSGRVENLTLEVPLTNEQSLQGGNVSVLVPARATCPSCRGSGGIGFYECLRCAGEGAISGEVPVSIAFPPGISKDHAVMIPLERFGIRNMHLTVLFRPTDGENAARGQYDAVPIKMRSVRPEWVAFGSGQGRSPVWDRRRSSTTLRITNRRERSPGQKMPAQAGHYMSSLKNCSGSTTTSGRGVYSVGTVPSLKHSK